MSEFPLGRSPKGKETVELRRVIEDRHGDPVSSDTLVTFAKCVVIPRELGEDSERGSLAIKGHQVFIPPQRPQWSAPEGEQEILDTDQLFVRGAWTEIEGHPATYVDLQGKLKGTMVTTLGEVR